MADAPRVTVVELKRRMDAGEDFTIIDTRNPQAWAESDTMIPEAVRIPADKFDEIIARIPKSRPVVACCTRPGEGSSASVARKLREKGYEAWALKGGFHAWQEAGLPVVHKRQAA